jgi:hypothetical protein
MFIVSDFEQVRSAVSDYVRDYIRALRRRKISYAKIGERLGVSHVWVMQLDKPEEYGRRTVGAEVEHRLADLLHGGSIDALRRAALHLGAGGNVVVEESGEPLEVSHTPERRSHPELPPAKAKR